MNSEKILLRGMASGSVCLRVRPIIHPQHLRENISLNRELVFWTFSKRLVSTQLSLIHLKENIFNPKIFRSFQHDLTEWWPSLELLLFLTILAQISDDLSIFSFSADYSGDCRETSWFLWGTARAAQWNNYKRSACLARNIIMPRQWNKNNNDNNNNNNNNSKGGTME